MLGLGAGGHGRVVLETLRLTGDVEVVGWLDPREDLWGTSVLGVPVLGGDDELEPQYHGGVRHVFIGLAGASDTAPRRRLYELARKRGCEVVSVLHPAAAVSPSATIGRGAQVLAAAVVGTGAAVGENAIVNTGAIIDHDCRIGAHAHVATGARLAGGVTVGPSALVGAGSTLIQGVAVGAGAIVGAGAVVLHDVEAGGVVAGVPARPLERRS